MGVWVEKMKRFWRTHWAVRRKPCACGGMMVERVAAVENYWLCPVCGASEKMD